MSKFVDKLAGALGFSTAEEEYDELYDIYDDYITKTKGGTCSIGTSC